jgi:type VI protein secretion system component Hcp
MADKSVDILMYIMDGSTGIPGEANSEIDTSDKFMGGFAGGNFFEVDDFDFGIQAVDTDAAASAPKTAPGSPPTPDPTKRTTGQFSTWMKNKTVSMDGGKFPIEMTPFQFTRQIDIASPLLFQRCFKTKPYNSAALVMRKVGGVQFGAKKNIAAMPFLRIDFDTVLIIKVDWDAGDVVKEKCSFVCRGVKVQYRQQAHHGAGFREIGGMDLSLVNTT